MSRATMVAAESVGLAGVVLGEDVLFLHHRGRYSFRVRLCNMVDMDRLKFVHTPPLWDPAYLAEYFHENQDNVYAVYNLANLLAAKLQGERRPVGPLTQLPPLHFPKSAEEQARGVDRLTRLARLGDLIFTYDRQSGIHRLIRRYDWGHWAHCGTVDTAGLLFEATLSGVARSPLAALKRPSLDVGLYRLRDHEFTPERLAQQRAFMNRVLANSRGYDWYGVLRIFILRRLGLWHRTRGLASMINSNVLELVAYA